MKEIDHELISVVMPVYNREQYIDAAIKSVIQQTYKRWELIIVDDGSTDSSYEIATKWSKIDNRIRLFANLGNQGICESRNRGIQEAFGSIVAFLDSDDIAEPGRFEKQMQLLNEGFDMVGSSVMFIDSMNNVIGIESVAQSKRDIEKLLRFTLPLPNPTLIAKRKVFTQVGEYRFPCAEDYDFFLRAYEFGFKVTNYPNPLVRMRMHLENTGVLHVRKQRFFSALAWKLHNERMLYHCERTDSAQLLADYRDNENRMEQIAAYYYRKAYILRNYSLIMCMFNLAIACIVWPLNVKHLLRRFL